MKKWVGWIIVIILVLSLTGCIYKPGERPTDYGPAFWVSSTPDIWFEVLEYDSEKEYQTVGYASYLGKTTKIIVFFAYSDKVSIIDFNDPDISYLLGSCIYGNDKLVVKVFEDKDQLFSGNYSTITFIRTTVSPESAKQD